MSERDLVKELRRVDETFSQLKTTRSDVVDALLDADPVDVGARRSTLAWLGLIGGAGTVAALVVVVVLVGQAPAERQVSAQVGGQTDAVRSPATPAGVVDTALNAPPTTPETAPPAPPAPLPATPVEPMTSWSAPLRLVEAPQGGLRSRALQPAGRVDVDAAPVTALPVTSNRAATAGATVSGVGSGVGSGIGSGVGSSDGSSDRDSLERGLERARALQARGAWADAAEAIAAVAVAHPDARVQDTLGFEQALLWMRAREPVRACAALLDHARRFPDSANAANVAAARARLFCP